MEFYKTSRGGSILKIEARIKPENTHGSQYWNTLDEAKFYLRQKLNIQIKTYQDKIDRAKGKLKDIESGIIAICDYF